MAPDNCVNNKFKKHAKSFDSKQLLYKPYGLKASKPRSKERVVP